MKCLNCENEDSKVVDSRSVQQGASIRRRRECNKCSFRFTTYEYIATTPIMVVKKNGTREEFDRLKLESSFNVACNKRPISKEMIMESIKKLEEKISSLSNVEVYSSEIGELVMEELKILDKVSFVRFASVYRDFQDIGEFQEQIKDLETSINNTVCEGVIIGTPIDLRRIINIKHPSTRVTYDLQEIGHLTLNEVLNPFLQH